MATINEWVEASYRNAVKHGWWEDVNYNVSEKLMLMVSELAEAMEEWRAGRGMNEIYYNTSAPTKPEGIPIELADVVIRIMDLCGREGIDLESAITLKSAYNSTRPYRHGGKLS